MIDMVTERQMVIQSEAQEVYFTIGLNLSAV